MLRLLQSVVCLAVSVDATSISNRGATAAVSQSMLERAKDAAVPILLDYLQNIDIPNQDLGSGLSLRDIHAHVDNVPNSAIELQAPRSAIISVTNLAVSSKLEAKWSFIKCHGKAKTTGASLALTMGAVANEAGTLTFSVASAHVDLGNFGIDMDSWACGAVNTIVGWFLDEKDKAEDAIKNALGSLAGTLNDLIDTWSYQVPSELMGLPAPFDQATLDLHFTDIEVATQTDTGEAYLQVGATGEVRDANKASQRTPLSATVLPDMSSADMLGHKISAEISNYTMDTAFYTFHEQGALAYLLDSATVDEGLRTALATDSPVWGVLGFGWDAVFDGVKNMSLSIETARRAPTVRIVDNGLTLDASMDFVFTADNSSAGEQVNPVKACVWSCEFTTSADLLVDASQGPISLSPFVHNDTMCTMSNSFSLVAFDGSAEEFLNTVLLPAWIPGFVDQLNGIITGIEIPTLDVATPKGQVQVEFGNATLDITEGVVVAGIDVDGGLVAATDHNGPSQMQQMWSRIKTELLHQVGEAQQTSPEEIVSHIVV